VDISSIRGGIPQSRVAYIKFCDKVIWHREKRIDLVLGSGVTNGMLRDTLTQYKGKRRLSPLAQMPTGEQLERQTQTLVEANSTLDFNHDTPSRMRVDAHGAVHSLLHDDRFSNVQMIILVGIPGSGKSTFAARLEEEGARLVLSEGFRTFSQDKIGSQEKMAKQVARELSRRHRVVIDRCNHTRAQRQFWRDLGLQNKRKLSRENILIVQFNLTKDQCIERVLCRKGHPNLCSENAPDRVIERVINRYVKEFEIIEDKEAAGFGYIVEVALLTHKVPTILQQLLKSCGVSHFEDVRQLLEEEVRVDVRTDGQLFSPMYRLQGKLRGGTDFSMQGVVESSQGYSRAHLLKRVADHCRGCIYEMGTNRMVGCGFDKFWEHNSKFAATSSIDWQTAVARLKMDGCIVKLYHYGGSWRVASNSMIDAGKARLPASGKTVADLFWDAAQNRIRLAILNQDMTYVFEVCHPANRIVVYYDKPELYLLATIESATGREVSGENMHRGLGNIVRPQVMLGLGQCTLEACTTLVRGFSSQREGLVITDGNSLRIKVKSPHWVLAQNGRGWNTLGFHLLSLFINPGTEEIKLPLSREIVANFKQVITVKSEELAEFLNAQLCCQKKPPTGLGSLGTSEQMHEVIEWLRKNRIRRLQGARSILEMARDVEGPILPMLSQFTTRWLQNTAAVFHEE